MSKASERFHETVIDFLEVISSCIQDLRQARMTSFTSVNVDVARVYLTNFPGDDLLFSFIDHHVHWNNIHTHNNRFILEDIPELSGDMKGVSVPMLTCPFEAYEKHGAKSPVTKDDIDTLWDYFEAMVCISCNFIFNERRSNPSFRSEIDIEKYAMLFSITLKHD